MQCFTLNPESLYQAGGKMSGEFNALRVLITFQTKREESLQCAQLQSVISVENHKPGHKYGCRCAFRAKFQQQRQMNYKVRSLL